MKKKIRKFNLLTLFGCFIIILFSYFVINSYDVYINPIPIETTIWINYEPMPFTMYQSVSSDIFIVEGVMIVVGIAMVVIGLLISGDVKNPVKVEGEKIGRKI